MSGPSAHNRRDVRASKELRRSLLPHIVDDNDTCDFNPQSGSKHPYGAPKGRNNCEKGTNMKLSAAFVALFLLGVHEVNATWTPQWVFDEIWARQEREREENDDNGDKKPPRGLFEAPNDPLSTEKELLEEQKRIQELYKQFQTPKWPEPSVPKGEKDKITPEKPKDGERK